MYQQPWQQQVAGQQQQHQGDGTQQPWGQAQQPNAPAQPTAFAIALGQQQAAGVTAWGAIPAGTAGAGGAAALPQAGAPAAAPSYQQYYQQQAAAVAAAQQAQQPAAVAQQQPQPPQLAAQAVPVAYYPPAGAPQLRQWTGTVTQIIPPNYGIVDGDAYYINAVVAGEVPKVGDRVRAEGVPNTEGSYKWRITRLQLESAAAAQAQAQAQAQQQAAAAASGASAQARPTSRFTAARPAEERQKLRTEATNQKYNAMAPPVAAYTSEVALATVESALGGGLVAAQAAAAQATAGLAEKRALLARSAAELDEETKKKAEQAVQQLGMDAANPGAKLLARMGFGTAGTGLGRNQQGISTPIDPVAVKGGTGLGFDLEKAEEEERAAREARRAARERERGSGPRHDRRRSRSRSRSPRRGRYTCSPPKFPTFEGERGVAAISKRYKELYLPSEFVKVKPSWQQSCPEHNPFPIDHPISFEVKEGAAATDASKPGPSPAKPTGTAAQPAAAAAMSEADVASGRRWSARVVLVGGMNPAHLYAGEKDYKLWQHPLRKLNVLLIKHDKREYGLIGGIWDPQDGGHPTTDPTALSRTAARHFKAATGLDLSACTQWLPFCELSYLRPESKEQPEHTEHTVIYLVDAWSLAQRDTEAEQQLQKASTAAGEEERLKRQVAEAEGKLRELEEAAKAAAEKAAGSKGEGGLGFEGLDPPNMNVQQLQEELTKRGLDTKWNPLKGKKELVDRLQEWIAENRTKRAAEDADFRASEEAKAAVEAHKEKIHEMERAYREARNATRAAEKLLQEPPATEKIVLHAAGEAADKKGRSLLSTPSLDVLLDYDDEDNREHGFEVALFAELFQEMLQQRFGRAILRALAAIDSSASKLKRTSSSRRDGKEDSKAGGRKRERSVSMEPEVAASKDAADGGTADSKAAAGDSDMADAERQQEQVAAAGGDGKDGQSSPATAKRQKTEQGVEVAAAAGSSSPLAADSSGGHVEHLLAACRYYDKECAGYLADEDLEEIAYMVSDSLSRKRVQSLVDSLVSRSGKFSYLEHASLQIPPAPVPTPLRTPGGTSGGAVVSENGVVIVNGVAVNVPALQQRLEAADAARRAAQDAQRRAEQEKAEAMAEKQRAQQAHEEVAIQLAQTKEQLTHLASTRSQSDMDASKARVALQAAELSLQELGKQLAEAAAALGAGVKTEQNTKEGAAA